MPSLTWAEPPSGGWRRSPGWSAGLDRVDRAPAATAAGAEVRRARLPGCPL